ncbi:hypothetical protein H4Q26_017844 [Puccinia striiformis f. sp. tritici PST-130]|nr:hypothetical protein H4Q26_017844 [Puccinia striiformis f. sp. tritici PST-130]
MALRSSLDTRQPHRIREGLDQNQTWRRETRRSLRKERQGMKSDDAADDWTLSKAVKEHIRIVTGLPRKTNAFPRLPTLKELENLPLLKGAGLVLSDSAPLVIKAKNVTQTWDPEETMSNNFSTYCLRRARQYGLPFVGLSIILENSKAREWNRRTAAFLSDTFYNAVEGGDYGILFRAGHDLQEGSFERVKFFIETNLQYRINEMIDDFKRAKSGSDMLLDATRTHGFVGFFCSCLALITNLTCWDEQTNISPL